MTTAMPTRNQAGLENLGRARIIEVVKSFVMEPSSWADEFDVIINRLFSHVFLNCSQFSGENLRANQVRAEAWINFQRGHGLI
jgi:hypothetical protein